MTVPALVATNLGIALVPSMMPKHHSNQEIKFIDLIEEQKVQRFGLALISKGPENPSPLDFFKEAARELFVF